MNNQDAAPAGAVPTGTEPIDPAHTDDTFDQLGRQVAELLRGTHVEVSERARLEAEATATARLAEADERLAEADTKLAEAERRLAEASVEAAALLAEADSFSAERMASITARESVAAEVLELAGTLVKKLEGRLVRIAAEGRAANGDLTPLRDALEGVRDLQAADGEVIDSGEVIDLRAPTVAAWLEA